MRRTQPKIHYWAHPYGDAVHDPWPGDLALGWHLCGGYRFDGQVWRVLQHGGADGT